MGARAAALGLLCGRRGRERPVLRGPSAAAWLGHGASRTHPAFVTPSVSLRHGHSQLGALRSKAAQPPRGRSTALARGSGRSASPPPSHAERLSLQPLGQVQAAPGERFPPGHSHGASKEPVGTRRVPERAGLLLLLPCRWRDRRPPSRCPRHPRDPARPGPAPGIGNVFARPTSRPRLDRGHAARSLSPVKSSSPRLCSASLPAGRLSLRVASGAPWGQAWFPLLGPSFSPHAALFPLTRGRLLVLKRQRCVGSAGERGASERRAAEPA